MHFNTPALYGQLSGKCWKWVGKRDKLSHFHGPSSYQPTWPCLKALRLSQKWRQATELERALPRGHFPGERVVLYVMTHLSSTCIHAVGPCWSLPYDFAAELTSSAKYLTCWSRFCGGVAPWLPLGQKRKTRAAVLVAGSDNVARFCLLGHLALNQRRVLLCLHFRVGNGGDASSFLSLIGSYYVWLFWVFMISTSFTCLSNVFYPLMWASRVLQASPIFPFLLKQWNFCSCGSNSQLQCSTLCTPFPGYVCEISFTREIRQM